jgi:hypothetical protein
VTAYVLLFYGDASAGFFAFGQGLLMDTLSAAPFGLFALLYMLMFLAMKLVSGLFDLASFKGQMLILLTSALLKGVLLVLLLRVLSLETIISTTDFFALGSSAVFTGLFAPLVFSLFNFVNAILFRGEEQGSE